MDAQREPLLGRAESSGVKHSPCDLHEACFLSDGSRKNAASQKKVSGQGA